MAAAHTEAELGSRGMRKNASLKLAFVAVVAVAFAAGARSANAQAKPGASRSAELSAYGGFSYAKPDFGPSNVNNTGGMLGVNYTRFVINFPIHPSIELRGTYNTGNIVTQSSVQGGLRGTYDFVDKYDFRDRLHPYFGIYGGGGVIKYDHYLGYPSDRGFILAAAVGLNVDAYKHFQVMADFELQDWNFGSNPAFKAGGANYTLSPKVISLGISYRLSAHSRGMVADNR